MLRAAPRAASARAPPAPRASAGSVRGSSFSRSSSTSRAPASLSPISLSMSRMRWRSMRSRRCGSISLAGFAGEACAASRRSSTSRSRWRSTQAEARLGIGFREQRDALLRRHRDVRGDQVREQAGRRDALHEGLPLVGHVVAQIDHALGEHDHPPPGRLARGRQRLGLGERMHLHAERRLPRHGAGHRRARATPTTIACLPSRRASMMRITRTIVPTAWSSSRPGFSVCGIALRDDEQVAVLAGLFERGERAGPTDRERHRDPGKDDHVPHRQHRQDGRHLERLGPGDLDGEGGDRRRPARRSGCPSGRSPLPLRSSFGSCSATGSSEPRFLS